jgi:hypothetical protein
VELPLEEPVITIGRLEDNTIQLHNEGVSRHHARLELRGNDYVLSDLGSTNGTQVNGVSITAPVALRDGDVVVIGGATLSYRSPTPSAGLGVSSRPRPQPADMPPQVRKAPAVRPAPLADQPDTPKKKGKGLPILAIVGGAVAALCVLAVCGGAAAYIVISQIGDTNPTEVVSNIPTPDQSLVIVAETPTAVSMPVPAKTSAGASSPIAKASPTPQALPTTKASATATSAPKITPAPANIPPNATVLAKAQDYNSAKGKYTIKLPAGAAYWETQNRLNVSYQGSGLAFSIEYFATAQDASAARNEVVTVLKERQGVTFATDRPAYINEAVGARSAAEYPEKNGQMISHTLFILEHGNGLFYVIQAIDNAADLEKDQAIFQGLIGGMVFRSS